MPIIKSAIKRMRTSAKRRDRNVSLKNDVKTAVKTFHATPNATTLGNAQGEYDRAVKKGLLKVNTAARRKSQLAKVAKAAGVSLSKTKKTTTKSTTKLAKAPAKKPTLKKPAKKSAPKKA